MPWNLHFSRYFPYFDLVHQNVDNSFLVCIVFRLHHLHSQWASLQYLALSSRLFFADYFFTLLCFSNNFFFHFFSLSLSLAHTLETTRAIFSSTFHHKSLHVDFNHLSYRCAALPILFLPSFLDPISSRIYAWVLFLLPFIPTFFISCERFFAFVCKQSPTNINFKLCSTVQVDDDRTPTRV